MKSWTGPMEKRRSVWLDVVWEDDMVGESGRVSRWWGGVADLCYRGK